MKNLFRFTVIETFQIEGRGLIIAPFFGVDKYEFDRNEKVRISRPDGTATETTAEFEVPLVSPMPKVHQAVCVLRNLTKDDVPIGSEVTLLEKTEEAGSKTECLINTALQRRRHFHEST
jgi:hypothetical protein